MKLEVNITKTYFFLIVSILILIIGGFFVFAYNSVPANPAVFGHSADEIEGVCRTDGSGCPGSISGESFVPITSTTDRGGSLVLKRNYNGVLPSFAEWKFSSFSGQGYSQTGIKKVYVEYNYTIHWDASGYHKFKYLYPDNYWRTFKQDGRSASGSDYFQGPLTGIVELPVGNNQNNVSLLIESNLFYTSALNNNATLTIIGVGYN